MLWMDRHYFYLKVGILSTLVGLYCPTLLLVASSSPSELFLVELLLSTGLRIPPNLLTSHRKLFRRRLAFGKSESRLQTIVRSSSSTGQALQGVIPQSSDANGSDQAPNPGQGWPKNRKWSCREEATELGYTLFPEESSWPYDPDGQI